MNVERVEAVVVGAGQAGLAMSEHLRAHGITHVVLERHRIAERWRSERWDSLVANGPAWHDRFPTLAFACSPEAFPGKDEVAEYFEAYARHIEAPVRCGVEVTGVTRLTGRSGFAVHADVHADVHVDVHVDARAEAHVDAHADVHVAARAVASGEGGVGERDGERDGERNDERNDECRYECDYVVAATGAFQQPVVPSLVPPDAPVLQLHSNAYHNPDQLPPGGVLVVGAGSSGAQIADDLLRAGRQVWLSVSPHGRPPRRYRGRDFVWWLGVLNKWDAEVTPGAAHVTIAVSGVDGGETIDFRRLAARGMTLVGTTAAYDQGVIHFHPDLAANLARGDADHLGLLDEADAYVAAHGLDLPAEPEARVIAPDPECVLHPLQSLDLAAAGVGSIIWATGYTRRFDWLPPGAVDPDGQAVHHRGISAEPGVYFLGLPWQTRRGSSFIWGVWYDAKYIADHIAKQRAYARYLPNGPSAART